MEREIKNAGVLIYFRSHQTCQICKLGRCCDSAAAIGNAVSPLLPELPRPSWQRQRGVKVNGRAFDKSKCQPRRAEFTFQMKCHVVLG